MFLLVFSCFLIVACHDRSSGSLGITQAPQTDPTLTSDLQTANSTSLAAQIGLPGNEIAIVPPQPIFETNIPILSSNYAIIWEDNFSEGEVIGQTCSGETIEIDPCAIAQGKHTLKATTPLTLY